MGKYFKIFILIALFLLIFSQLNSQTYGIRGQLSGWTILNPEKPTKTQLGIRYIPEFSFGKNISENYSISSELSFNSYADVIYSEDSNETRKDLKPYRLWLRFASTQFELRAGLQKINFGSASLLRPLMWFDKIDPRDPLQMTDGVYGLLARYYFLNNTNIWVWGLYGNDETKGWEVLPSQKDEIEYGGRIQIPLFTGEIAASYHHRKADLSSIPYSALLFSDTSIPEDRFGLDGKWDYVVGFWIEGCLIHQDIEILQSLKYQKLYNIGVDYTFNLGNGLNVITEYFTLETSEKISSSTENISFFAGSLNYPLGLIDNITTMVYHNKKNKDLYRFINWQRKYDNLSFYLIGFWNPDKFEIYNNKAGGNLFSGKGIQLMVTYNH